MEESWAPDALAIGPQAAYLRCAAGASTASFRKCSRAEPETVTTRNWATVLKLQAALNVPP
jgi:methylphosphotriester-DNA--protein-cysteine methyltransferase